MVGRKLASLSILFLVLNNGYGGYGLIVQAHHAHLIVLLGSDLDESGSFLLSCPVLEKRVACPVQGLYCRTRACYLSMMIHVVFTDLVVLRLGLLHITHVSIAFLQVRRVKASQIVVVVSHSSRRPG